MNTSIGYLGKAVRTEQETTAQQATSEREAMFGDIPGQILAFDSITQKARIQPLYKPRHNNKPLQLPVLEDVMVHFYHGKKGGLTFPVQAGDRVTLKPQMRNTELYHTKDNFEAKDTRSFSLSDMEAYHDGGLSLVKPIPNFSGLYANFRYDEMGSFGWFGSDDGRTKCVLAPGELIDTLAELSESCGAASSLSGNIQLLEILIDKTDNLLSLLTGLISAYKQHRTQSLAMATKCASDATGWTQSSAAFTKLSTETQLTGAAIYATTASNHLLRATESTNMATINTESAAAYTTTILLLNYVRAQLILRRINFAQSLGHFAKLSTKLRNMELRD